MCRGGCEIMSNVWESFSRWYFNLIVYLGKGTQKPGDLKLIYVCSCPQIMDLGYSTHYLKGFKKIGIYMVNNNFHTCVSKTIFGLSIFMLRNITKPFLLEPEEDYSFSIMNISVHFGRWYQPLTLYQEASKFQVSSAKGAVSARNIVCFQDGSRKEKLFKHFISSDVFRGA